MSRIQSPSSARADGDTIQENTIRIAEQEVSPAAGRCDREGDGGHLEHVPKVALASLGCMCGVRGDLTAQEVLGNLSRLGSLLHFIPCPLPWAILLDSRSFSSSCSACRRICDSCSRTCGLFPRGATASSTRRLRGPAHPTCVLNLT